MMGKTGAFSSLGINELLSNSQKKSGENAKFSKNYNSLSLPNLVLSERYTSTPNFVRHNYPKCVCDDEIESSEQPIDFSKKYCETKINQNEKIVKAPRNCTFNKVVKSYNNTFSMYAETDLDQPTDYSLRYAEDDSDSDEHNKIPKNETAEFVQDTIKTYCTEDTPYETPFNFSTSTSMSDLRIDDKTAIENKLSNDTEHAETFSSKEIPNVHQIQCTNKIVKSGFSSGLMSPEKPVNYCEEGTPGYFSRVASCGSLNSIPVNDPPKQEVKEENLDIDKVCDKETRRTKFPTEMKAVKFEDVVNYAEETPLMFSRSSSLASLDSIEQHSIHDDRSSVVSDFSRLTSGLISPSELPDSPSQTVPPSPKPRKNPITFPPVSKKKTDNVIVQSPTEIVPKSSIFEDVVKKFKMESTPLQFSTATSLSSLIIDDHDEVDSKIPNGAHSANEESPINEIKVDNNDDLSNIDNNDLSDGSEDEDILAACINIGMQNNRYNNPKSSISPPNEANKFTEIVNLNNSRVTPRNSPQHLPVPVTRTPVEITTNSTIGQKIDVTDDSLKTYCTEGTPAILSHAGSNSDLSVLSMQGGANIVENNDNIASNLTPESSSKIVAVRNDSQENLLSLGQRDEVDVEKNEDGNSRRSSFSSISDCSHESEQALLQECILAGMPKTVSKAVEITKESVEVSNSDQNLSKESIVESDISDDEDDDILADCISIGMKNNRYTAGSAMSGYKFQSNVGNSVSNNDKPPVKVLSKNSDSNKSEVINDSVKSYYTEDTPALLSHAGSNSDLSVLSVQGTENSAMKDYLSDLNSNFSDDDDDDDEQLLAECVRFGMAKITGATDLNRNRNTDQIQKESTDSNGHIHYARRGPTNPNVRQKVDNADDNQSCRSSLSSFSDGSYESEQALLQECILAGMPKGINRLGLNSRSNSFFDNSNELSEAEKALLQQCILEGMKKCRISPKKTIEDDTSELTEADQALLRQCILSGMPKNKNLTLGGPSASSRDSTDLTESERLLLQQCILAGMPKNRTNFSLNKSLNSTSNVWIYNKDVSSRQWSRRPRETERNSQEVEHTCCIHCPRLNQNRVMFKQNNHVRSRRKYRERNQFQIRDNRDVNILYVSNQILALKKEIVDRSREEWV